MADLLTLKKAAVGWNVTSGTILQRSALIKGFSALALVLFLLGCNLMAFAAPQETSVLQGSVVDEKDARIVGASVTLEDGLGRSNRTRTDRQGQYRLVALSRGPYMFTVTAQGFAELQQSVEFGSARTVTLNATLKVFVSERVEVQAAQNTLSAVTITGQRLAALPQDARQLLLRLRRLAGATGTPDDLAIYVDGFRDDGRLPPKEMIESIRINSDPFAAEFAEPDRARVEITTKPATGSVHGEFNFNFNDESLNARDKFALRRVPLQLRNYSGVFSGPIKRNRWGYLFGLNRREQQENAVVNATILNPATLLSQPFSTTVVNPTLATDVSFRTSYLFGKNQMFDFRYSHSNEANQNQGLDTGFDLPERSVNRTSRDDTFRLSLTSVNERSLNETRLELSRRRAGAFALDSERAVFVLDAFTAGGNQESLFSNLLSRNLRFTDTLTYSAGSHTWKGGVLINAVQLKDTDRSNFGGTFIFGTDLERNSRGLPVPGSVIITPIDSYRRKLLGLPGYRPLQFSINRGDPFVGVTQWETGLFVQDDWRVSPRLTLSYGLRSEFQSHLEDKLNLAPRAALALRPFKSSDSVLRVGAGLFYSRLDPGITIDTARFNGLREEELVTQRPAFFATIPAVFNRATTLTTLRTKSVNLNAPYSFISTVNYEQQLPWKMSATFGFTFERGEHLLRTRNINAPLPASPDLRPFPDQGPILQYESTGILKRHEFIAVLNGNLSSKLTFYGSYRLAFAHSDTDGATIAPANSDDLTTEFGRAASDQRHQFYFEAYVELPWGLQLSPNVFAASGPPFNITTGSDDNSDTLFTDRPAFAKTGDPGAIVTRFGVFNPHPQLGDSIVPRNFGRGPGEVSVNVNLSRTFTFAFAPNNAAREITNGEASATNQKSGRGFFRRFSDRRYSVTFSLDAYNLLNHTNFGEFNGVVTSPVFGLPNRANDARRINLGVNFSF